jgi:hypothetical protein
LDDHKAGSGEGRVEEPLATKTTSAAAASSLKTKFDSFLEANDGVGVHDEGLTRSQLLQRERSEQARGGETEVTF